ncbi:hypothetical protein QBC33DRAFT_551701 [Phialemonium atrogriseum]|uniref:Uncharacterized protein n=1 Tax=Phialemonium atrogriseum TaxID=1093897 RepID=A0AAJ0FIW3_9PEZI|nr:uncharacterized protein QBC33DRAFT_551701 [Phialemonium atrogriseum]KAK1762495.1 hypothetical protein QBC33DRAFT_551701 [Phialemonium atrogriseum]
MANSTVYAMTINITNNTDNDLKPLGATFYDGDGDVQQQPKTVLAHSTGDGGVLEKVGGTDGLFGLVAYATPDPTQTLVIYITMPALSGTNNHCWVGLVPSSTNINPALAKSCYDGPPSGFSEGQITWKFSQSGEKFFLVVKPSVADKRAYLTSSTVELDIYHQGSEPSGS